MVPISYLCGVFVIPRMGVTNLCVSETLLEARNRNFYLIIKS